MAFHREHAEQEFQTDGMPQRSRKIRPRGDSLETLRRLSSRSHDVVAFGASRRIAGFFDSANPAVAQNPRICRNRDPRCGAWHRPKRGHLRILWMRSSQALALSESITAFVGLFESISLGPRFHLPTPTISDWKRLNLSSVSLDVYENDGFICGLRCKCEQVGGARGERRIFYALSACNPASAAISAPARICRRRARTVLRATRRAKKVRRHTTRRAGQSRELLNGNPNVNHRRAVRAISFPPRKPRSSDYPSRRQRIVVASRSL